MTPGENMKVSEGAVLSPDIPLLSIDRLTVQSGGIPLIDELELDVSAGSSVAIIDSGRGSKAAPRVPYSTPLRRRRDPPPSSTGPRAK